MNDNVLYHSLKTSREGQPNFPKVLLCENQRIALNNDAVDAGVVETENLMLGVVGPRAGGEGKSSSRWILILIHAPVIQPGRRRRGLRHRD